MNYLRLCIEKRGNLIFLIICIVIVLDGCTSNPEILLKDKGIIWEEDRMIKNPIELPKKVGDVAADPFVMRFNGWYYLYTTGDVNIWRSKNLADWEYMGTANDAEPLSMAFAPEVYYWNGKFYMYTSPSGKGHYILEANEPTGPFNYVTNNLGLTIDGSVFIEDDGTWYFTRAGDKGIVGHEMISPTDINPIGKTLDGYMGHWTEGSMIIKRDGRYYMTYTGNHFQSSGYRVNYSVSEEGSFGKYKKPSNNPILINDRERSHALGHSSFVYGPDLDSMYIAYHSYVVGKSHRMLNIDRLSFNGERMYVNGPTWFDMPVANLPAFGLWPEDNPTEQMKEITLDGWGALVSKEETGETFTAEWNFSGGDGDTGILFYNDKDKYIRVLWHRNTSQVTVDKYSAGDFESLGSFELPKGYNPEVLHCVRMQYSQEQLNLYLDGMHKLLYRDPGLGAGYIGYIYEGTRPNIGFTGFSHAYMGSGDHSAIKPIPGKFDAAHHILDGDRDFGSGVSAGKLSGDIKTLVLGGKGAWVSYGINVEKDGIYGMALQVKADKLKNAKTKVLQDGESLGVFELNKNRMSDLDDYGSGFVKLPIGNVPLKSGIHELSLQSMGGKEIEILEVEIYEVQEDKIQMEYDLTRRKADMEFYGDGIFAFREEGMNNHNRADIKMTLGDRCWTDYRVRVDIVPGDFATGNSGLIFRATNESYHPHQNINAMQGYYVGMNGKSIFLKRMNYEDTETIEEVELQMEAGSYYSIEVKAKGNSIKVYIDDNPDPIISYFDRQPFLFGRVGIWSYNDVATYKNLKISSIE